MSSKIFNLSKKILPLGIIALFLSIPTFLLAQPPQRGYSRSYNERYYGYGIPFSPNISTPRAWGKRGPRFHKDHYYRFGYQGEYGGRNDWFMFHYIIEY